MFHMLEDYRGVFALTPVLLVEWLPGDWVRVQTPEGDQFDCPAAFVGGHDLEETLPVLAPRFGLSHNTLAVAVAAGRVLARRSGRIWLTTERAIRYAMNTGGLTVGNPG